MVLEQDILQAALGVYSRSVGALMTPGFLQPADCAEIKSSLDELFNEVQALPFSGQAVRAAISRVVVRLESYIAEIDTQLIEAGPSESVLLTERKTEMTSIRDTATAAFAAVDRLVA